MRLVVLFAFSACVLSAPLAAQSCGSGSTSTLFSAGLGGNGAFFDLAIGAADMSIECLDLLAVSSTGVIDVEVYYAPTTSFGIETTPAAWTLFASVTGVSVAAQGTPTTVDISGNGMSFAAGQSYGLLVTTSNGQVVEYTPGAPTTYPGTHCDLTTNGGTLYPFQFLFADRRWNGTLRTEVLPPTGPTLAASGTCPGATTLTVTNATPGGAVAFAYAFAQGAWVLPGGPACAGTVLPLVQPVLLGIQSADIAGTATFSGNAPAAACGSVSVAALDLATCTPTAAVAL